jgi:hypothetical protein
MCRSTDTVKRCKSLQDQADVKNVPRVQSFRREIGLLDPEPQNGFKYVSSQRMRGIMKTNFKLLFVMLMAGLVLFMGACSNPTPNPQPQTKTPEPEARPVADQPREPAEEVRNEVVDVTKARPVAPVAKEARKTPVTRQAANTARPLPQPSAAPASASVANKPESAPGTLTLPAPVAPPIAVPAPPADDIKPIAVEPPPPRQVRVPSGTLVSIRTIDSIDSETAHEGETFKASLDEPILVDNETVFPKGSEVYVKLAKVQSAGRVSGRSELQLQLDRIFLGRKSYALETSTYVNTGASQGGRTARSAGIGAAIGAAIGAISGGGKGAVIGGATGAGAGAGVEAIRKGEQVRVESETRIDFRLEAPIEVTLQSPSTNTFQRTNPSGPVRLGTRQ